GALLVRRLAAVGVEGRPHTRAVLVVAPVLRAGGQQRPPVGGELAALRDDADERGRRLERKRLLDRGDDRDAVLALPRPRRVEDRDHVVASIAEDAVHRLAVVRVLRIALGEYEIALLAPPAGAASRRAEPGFAAACAL